MTPLNVQAKLTEIFPGFEGYWNSRENLHREEDGSATLCGLFAEFSHFMREHFNSLTPQSLDHLSEFIEQRMELPGSDLDTAVATCFLENVAEESFTTALSQHLGGRAFLSQWGQ